MMLLKRYISFQDIFFNFLAYILFGLSGLGINLYLFFFGSLAAVGVFNQFYALFVISGQLFSLSIPEFNLRNLPIIKSQKEVNNIVSISLLVSLLSSFCSFFILIMSKKIIYIYTDSLNIKDGIPFLALAIFFFILNKNFFAILIALKKFVNFAVLNSLRSLLLIAFTFLLLDNNDYSKLALVFTFSEFFVFIICVFLLRKNITNKINNFREKIYSLFVFCKQSILYSFLSDTFLRIDIIILTYFFTDKFVGVYALASIFSEGIFQISVYIRNLANPQLSEFSKSKKYSKKFFLKFSIISFFLTILVSTFILIIFLSFNVFYEHNYMNFDKTFFVLIVLLIGVCLYSLISPFEMIFVLSGYPLMQSMIILFVSLMNVVLNFILIYYFGLIGAAFSTMIVFIIYGMLTYYFSSIILKLKYGLFFSE